MNKCCEKRHCTYCGKCEVDAFKLIAAPNNAAFICEGCVDTAHHLMQEIRVKEMVKKWKIVP